MPHTYFDRSHNLQINGDITFISAGGPTQDRTSFFHVTQRVQGTTDKSRAIERGAEIFKTVCDNTAPSAQYGYGHAFKGPQCHTGTRTAVQECIFNWLDDVDGQIAMWMKGAVGIGKSAIAQTVARLAAEKGRLSSAFFFFRSDDTRNSAKHLVATLAYEMTQQMPRTRSRVCRAVAENPLIFSSSLDRQMQGVLLQSLRTRFESSSRPRRLIIIDGLDECLDIDTQQGIIRSFISCLLSSSAHIIPHKLLIVSRPESHITSAFLASDILPHVKHLSLDVWDTKDDIGKFLHDKLRDIKETHPWRDHLPPKWPDVDSFRKLQQRSVGSFAYASCVVRFLASHKHDPEHALQDILSLQPRNAAAAFADLDALYRHILSGLDPDICCTVLKVLCLHLYIPIFNIAILAEGLSEEQSVLEIALVHVSSLIDCDGQFIKLHHNSFTEFLRDKQRSGNHHVFSDAFGSAVATALSKLWLNPAVEISRVDWFGAMGNNILTTNNDLNNHILHALVASKIPPSFQPANYHGVSWFFKAIQERWAQNSDLAQRSLYSKAFDVVCSWLRSQLNVFLQGCTTLSDILDIILKEHILPCRKVSEENFGPYILGRLAPRGHDLLDFLCRLLPETDFVGVCCRIMERYLALPIWLRQKDQAKDFNYSITLTYLYGIVLDHHESIDPKLCRQLEQLVLDGQKALSFKTRQLEDRTSKHCILHILYGEEFFIDDKGQWYIEDSHGDVYPVKEVLHMVVARTDDYICKAHAKVDFPYISEEVEALYHFQSEESYFAISDATPASANDVSENVS